MVKNMNSMQAIKLKGPGEASLVEMPMPAIGPDDVLVRSRAVGICGSDVELYRGTRPEGYYRYPIVPGHEWSGEVVAIGENVRAILPEAILGAKVVVEGFLFCGSCRNCRTGLTNLCERGYNEIGFTRTGGMAEYVAVLARQVHVLPSTSPLEQAALLEPTSVVVHAFLRAQPRAGDIVAVVGDGAIGQLAVQVARLFNPSAIFMIGSRPERLAIARQLGATHTINSREDNPLEVLASHTGGRGVELVFEGGTRPEGVAMALRLARRGGTVLLEGIAGGHAQLNIESDIFVLNHLAVFGIFGANSAAWTFAVQLFSSGLLNLTPLITHRFPLADYQQAIDTLVERRPGTLKVMLLHEAQ
jgi:threonine dehydrogenase-like Zn-dependent dehydrogenase